MCTRWHTLARIQHDMFLIMRCRYNLERESENEKEDYWYSLQCLRDTPGST